MLAVYELAPVWLLELKPRRAAVVPVNESEKATVELIVTTEEALTDHAKSEEIKDLPAVSIALRKSTAERAVDPVESTALVALVPVLVIVHAPVQPVRWNETPRACGMSDAPANEP